MLRQVGRMECDRYDLFAQLPSIRVVPENGRLEITGTGTWMVSVPSFRDANLNFSIVRAHAFGKANVLDPALQLANPRTNLLLLLSRSGVAINFRDISQATNAALMVRCSLFHPVPFLAPDHPDVTGIFDLRKCVAPLEPGATAT